MSAATAFFPPASSSVHPPRRAAGCQPSPGAQTEAQSDAVEHADLSEGFARAKVGMVTWRLPPRVYSPTARRRYRKAMAVPLASADDAARPAGRSWWRRRGRGG